MPFYITCSKTGWTSSEGIHRAQHARQQLAKLRKADPFGDWSVVYKPSGRRPSSLFGKGKPLRK